MGLLRHSTITRNEFPGKYELLLLGHPLGGEQACSVVSGGRLVKDAGRSELVDAHVAAPLVALVALVVISWVVTPTAIASTGRRVVPGYGASAGTPIWNVAQFIEGANEKDRSLVLISAGTDQGIISGLVLKSFRVSDLSVAMEGRKAAFGEGSYQSRLPLRSGRGADPIPNNRVSAGNSSRPVIVETGSLKVTVAKKNYALAEVTSEGSTLSRALFPKFSGIMAGDTLMRQQVALMKSRIMTPEKSLSYFSLFDDPKANPSSFELSSSGEDLLRRASKVFAQSKMAMLMVEGYTDHNGPSSANQIESYQRALTVRQFLIDSLGFDPKRVLAIGFGESEVVDNSMVQGYRARNRRILLKVSSYRRH